MGRLKSGMKGLLLKDLAVAMVEQGAVYIFGRRVLYILSLLVRGVDLEAKHLVTNKDM